MGRRRSGGGPRRPGSRLRAGSCGFEGFVEEEEEKEKVSREKKKSESGREINALSLSCSLKAHSLFAFSTLLSPHPPLVVTHM